MGEGWHNIWDPARANGNGRSDGTAVLTRRPTQIVRGGTLARGTIAIVSWARWNRLHIGSRYNAQAAAPAHPEATAQIFQEWQAYVAGLGSVPWMLGGDWNVDPSEVTDKWYRRDAAMIGIGTATLRQGRNIDWYLSNIRVPVHKVAAEVISGAGHGGLHHARCG